MGYGFRIQQLSTNRRFNEAAHYEESIARFTLTTVSQARRSTKVIHFWTFNPSIFVCQIIQPNVDTRTAFFLGVKKSLAH